jgi:hypothetical protein
VSILAAFECWTLRQENIMTLKLIIGNKRYSSWSMRPWIAMKTAGIAFEEIVIPLYEPGSKEEMLKFSPTGKVPTLVDGNMVVWETIAILEHLAERFPDAKLWPADPAARAHARSISAEMHSGFSALRAHCPMNTAREGRAPHYTTRGSGGHRAYRCDVERGAPTLWSWRAIFVWSVQHCRRDVRASGLPLCFVCGRCQHAVKGVYGIRHQFACLARMGTGRLEGKLDHANQ